MFFGEEYSEIEGKKFVSNPRMEEGQFLGWERVGTEPKRGQENEQKEKPNSKLGQEFGFFKQTHKYELMRHILLKQRDIKMAKWAGARCFTLEASCSICNQYMKIIQIIKTYNKISFCFLSKIVKRLASLQR